MTVIDTTTNLPQPRLFAPGEGEHVWFLNTLQTLKLGRAETGNNLTVLEFLAPPGFGPPLHRHDLEDELFFVLEGEVTFWCGGQDTTYGPGGLAWLPRGLAHRFQVGDAGPARVFQLTTPAQFDDFVRRIGEPASGPVLPEPSPPDVDELVRVAADFQIEILPPNEKGTP